MFNSRAVGGAWSLYIIDDSEGGGGAMAGGWSLELFLPSGSDYIPLNAWADRKIADRIRIGYPCPEVRSMIPFVLAVALMQMASGIVSVTQGSRSAIGEPKEATARTPAEWQALWKEHGAGDAAPAVDFAKEMVAAVFLGTRPTGGYAVEIRSTRRDGKALVVEYAEERPGTDAIVTQALTSPFHIVRMPSFEGPVTFRRVSLPSGVR